MLLCQIYLNKIDRHKKKDSLDSSLFCSEIINITLNYHCQIEYFKSKSKFSISISSSVILKSNKWILTHLVDFVENREGNDDASHPVAPDPLLLNVKFKWKLRNFRGEGVRVLHGTAGSLSVGHVDYGDICKTSRNIM